MSLINLPAIETDIGTIFHAAMTRFKNIVDSVTAFVDKAAASPLGKLALSVAAKAAPTEAGAATAAIAVLNAFDVAVDATVGTVAPAAGTKVSITMEIEAELLADWQAAKKALVQFESTV